MTKAYLILADGTIFEGQSIGSEGVAVGETVFTTGMTGYLETLTDPSFYGQIVTQTFPLIGNYGVIDEDFESQKAWARGYIVREVCDKPSNFRCVGALDDFLKSQGVVGIRGVDTRALTKKLRAFGVMNGMIVSGEKVRSVVHADGVLKCGPDILSEICGYKIVNAVEAVSRKNESFGRKRIAQGYPEINKNILKFDDKKIRIVLWDFGAKDNIPRELEKRGVEVVTVPHSYTFDRIKKLSPDGIMLSNGPGDPADNAAIIAEIRKLCDFGKIPMFGICLGHQMLALARGAKTAKLKYGHRGGNHPVKDTATGRVYITSQNHGYAVEGGSLPGCATLRFVNANDGTCEGIDYTDIPAFSVQFHPEACGGPHDTNFLFDRFLEMIQCH